MKRSFYLSAAVLLLVFVWSFSSFAADKIGLINVNEIIQKSAPGKKKVDDFKKYIEKKKDEAKAMEKELMEIKDELEKQGSTMSISTRQEKESSYQKKLRNFQILVNDTDEDLKRRDQEAIQKMLPGIMKIVRNIAEKEKYTLVLDLSTTQIPYYSTENDFTQKVIEEYDKTI
jgi:outer membrane protein